MKPNDIVISKAGAVTPVGIGFEAMRQGLRRSEHRLGPITLFSDQVPTTQAWGSQLNDFDPKAILGDKGLRYKDRNTLITLSCIQLDLADRIQKVGDPNAIAMVVGTMFGSLFSQIDFTLTYVEQGFKALNAMSFPNMVINTPPSQANIWFDLAHSSTTISNAFTGGIDALVYATDMIRKGETKFAIAGGSDEFSMPFSVTAQKSGMASKTHEVRPFDAQRNGTLMGEGAAMFFLEQAATAEQNGAKPIAVVLGSATTFDGATTYGFSRGSEGAIQTMRFALAEAGLKPTDIDFVAASANGSVDGDAMEAEALRQVFGTHTAKLPITAYGSYWGECYSARSAMQVAAALADLQDGTISATCGYRGGQPDLQITREPVKGRAPKTVMINSFGYTGHNTTLILQKV